MGDSPLGRFFGVVTHARTWLNLLFHVLAFPLGLFYFVFLVVGLSVGLGLVVIWVGIPILLVVAGAWWLFGAFERVQARYLLGADVPEAPRAWEAVNGIWGKFKAHFGSAATWKDLLYLLAKLAFGVVSFSLLVGLGALITWLFALPLISFWDVATVTLSDGRTWVPPLWLAILGIPAGVLVVFAGLHLLNGWGWVCARWAELMFRTEAAAAVAASPPAPLVSTSPAVPAPPAPPLYAPPEVPADAAPAAEPAPAAPALAAPAAYPAPAGPVTPAVDAAPAPPETTETAGLRPAAPEPALPADPAASTPAGYPD